MHNTANWDDKETKTSACSKSRTLEKVCESLRFHSDRKWNVPLHWQSTTCVNSLSSEADPNSCLGTGEHPQSGLVVLGELVP